MGAVRRSDDDRVDSRRLNQLERVLIRAGFAEKRGSLLRPFLVRLVDSGDPRRRLLGRGRLSVCRIPMPPAPIRPMA